METPHSAFGFPDAISRISRLEETLGTAIRGKADVLRLSIVCLLARGHLLIEDVPGVGKTTLAQALARCVQSSFHRLQFTSDMLPGDVLGVTVYNARSGEFEFKQGPVFTNFLLADEMNRATPKTQSALLEAMNERQVTIDGRSYLLADPFMVIATQNPVEHHGTYPLPESQLDRFLMRVRMGYPDSSSEREILRGAHLHPAGIQPVLEGDEIVQLRALAPRVRVDEALVGYMLAIVDRTRHHDSLALGVSPRGAQALFRASQALALVEGRDYVIADDIKRLAAPVFAHRVALNARVAPGQRTSGLAERVLEEILTFVEVPL
ncbi:MAG: MoxR family ATPase [Candidatus Solibacter usitatus]|nr:MoxR family ATPase [Candidatus Solibacter usitatus]